MYSRKPPNPEPRDDIWPTETPPVFRRREHGVKLVQLRWGFPPSRPKSAPVINFRSEGRRFPKDGIDAMRGAREQRPDLPVLFATGYADAVPFSDGDIDRNCLVCKPFRRDELFQRIQACMGERTSEGYAGK